MTSAHQSQRHPFASSPRPRWTDGAVPVIWALCPAGSATGSGSRAPRGPSCLPAVKPRPSAPVPLMQHTNMCMRLKEGGGRDDVDHGLEAHWRACGSAGCPTGFCQGASSESAQSTLARDCTGFNPCLMDASPNFCKSMEADALCFFL